MFRLAGEAPSTSQEPGGGECELQVWHGGCPPGGETGPHGFGQEAELRGSRHKGASPAPPSALQAYGSPSSTSQRERAHQS